MSRPRLAYIVSHPIQYIAPWHSAVARRGEIDLRVLFCSDFAMGDDTDPGFGQRVKWDIPLLEGYEHEFLPIAKRPERLSFLEVDNPTVGAALTRFAPDVVLIHGYAYRTNLRAARWTRKNGKPLMLFSDSAASLGTALWKQMVKEVLIRHVYSYIDGAFYISDANMAYHLYYGLHPERLFKAMYPIDRERILRDAGDRDEARRRVRERHGIPQDAFVVVGVGKYIERKRPLDLIRAGALAAERGSSVWTLHVGEGPDRAEMEAVIRDEHVRNAVLTGFVNQSGLAEYYAAADALALLSNYEAAGVVLPEAAVFGLPLIVSHRVGYIGDHSPARPRVNALICPLGDTVAIAAAIEVLCSDRTLYARMSAASTEIAKGEDVSVAAEALIEAIHEMCRLGPRANPGWFSRPDR